MKNTSNRFLDLTMNLLRFHTYSGNEGIMSSFIKQELQKLGFRYKQDKAGNIFAVRGKASTYPLLNAHMDIVFSVSRRVEQAVQNICVLAEAPEKPRLCSNCSNLYDCAQFHSESSGGKYYNELLRLQEDKSKAQTCESYEFDAIYCSGSSTSHSSWYRTGFSDEELKVLDEFLDEHYKIKYDFRSGMINTNKLRVLGGDDKCGIAIALQAARELPKTPMKILFTVEEEQGCIGIEEFLKDHSDWLDDVAYSVTIDRRGVDHLLMYSCGRPNCTPEFASKIAAVGIRNGVMVKMEEGTLADVIYIRQHVAETVNISAGYFDPHSTDEYINFIGMCKIKEWVKGIIQEVNV